VWVRQVLHVQCNVELSIALGGVLHRVQVRMRW
jgi:hypothetical protein